MPQSLRDGRYALGASRAQTVTRVVVPAALSGIVASFILAVSRAIGETMIVAIAAGQSPNLTLDPLVPVETMTAYIVQVSLGDMPTGTLEYRTIFAVGMTLFLMTFALNLLSHRHRARGSGRSTSDMTPTEAWRRRVRRNERLFELLSLAATCVGLVVLARAADRRAGRRAAPRLDWQFLTSFPSRRPESAGIYSALVGTIWLLVLTALIAFPIGVATAIYLEEYARAGPPSRSSSRSTSPTWRACRRSSTACSASSCSSASSTRSRADAACWPARSRWRCWSCRSSSSRRARRCRRCPTACGSAATRSARRAGRSMSTLVLPPALPGILTGTILALARAIGETAPLITMGALTYVAFVPELGLEGLRSPFTALPIQIFNWVSRPQAGFHVNAAAGIVVLLVLMLLMNLAAIVLRNRYQKRRTG